MSLLLILAVFAALLVIGTDLLAWGLLNTRQEAFAPEPSELATVAILIAARNEAGNLPRCLRAIEKLDYPPEQMMVLIGNDNSIDKTREIAHSFCRNKNNWQVLDIREASGQAKGKANVLAQLAWEASSFADYFFITDADVAVSPNWVKCMLPFFRHKVGVINGATLVEGESFFSRVQYYDWLKGLGLMKAFSLMPKWGKTLTATGNNMAVRKEAYLAVGGYENIPFSLTEDFELHRHILMKGYLSIQVHLPDTKAVTLPLPDLKTLLHQRKRWMSGAMELPWLMVALLFIQAFFIPCILVVLLYKPLIGLVLLVAKVLAQAFLIRSMGAKVGEEAGFPFLGYEAYTFFLNISQITFFLLPIRVKWKDRTY